MVPDNKVHVRIDLTTIIFVFFGLAAGLQAGEIPPLRLSQPPDATRTLSFPPDQCMGNLNLEPESGSDWDSEHVRLYGEWKWHSAAQGDVLVPEGRNVQLRVRLALRPQESARLREQNPMKHQVLIAERTRKDPEDLTGLLELNPNDLFWLAVDSAMSQRIGTDPGMFGPIHRLTGLKILTLHDTGITDKGLEHLRALRSLKGLEFTESSITSKGLAVLKDLPALEYLGFNEPVTDASLRQVAQVSDLRWLRVRTGRIWGPGLAELAKTHYLERLCLVGSSPISDRHIKYLEGLTQLKSLTLWGGTCSRLTDASLASISKLKNLEELHFIRANPKFTVKGVAYLKQLNNLKKVDFAQIWAGPSGAEHGDEVVRQLAALPNLESIKGLSYLSAEGMKALISLRNLKCLGIALKNRRQGYYGPTGVCHLANLVALERLHLNGGEPLTDADLACLEPLKYLREMHIMGGDAVTERGLASIGKLRRLEKLTIFCPVTRNALNQLNGLTNLQHLQVNAHPRGNAVAAVSDELTLDLSGLKNMKDMNLSGLPLSYNDLAFLKNMPLLDNLMIQPNSTLTGESLHHLGEMPELFRLWISGLSDCTGEDLEYLNSLPKLRRLTLRGDIKDDAVSSLTGPLSLESLNIDTDEPIRKQTVTDLAKRFPVIEYIRINELPQIPTRPPQQTERTRVGQPRTNRRAPHRR